jgi:hypothetical protein
MEFFLSNILTPIILTVVGYIVRIIYVKAKTHYKNTLPLKQFWRFSNDDISVVTSCYNSGSLDALEMEELGYKSDLLGSAKISRVLYSIYGTYPQIIMFSEKNKVVTKNLAIIGGPIHCELSKSILNNPQIPFMYEDYTLINKITHKKYNHKIDKKSNYISSDYIIIVNAKNPFDKDYRIVLISGCRNIGIEAGCLFASNISKSGSEYKRVRKFLRKNKNSSFYILLKVSSIYGAVGEPEILEMQTFND